MVVHALYDIFLGFDPGGEGNFGWSICREDKGSLEIFEKGLADDAWHALCKVKQALASDDEMNNSPVKAAGIDAPLMWNSRGDMKGYRKADCRLLRTLTVTRGPKDRVLACNSLFGAVVVQGPLLARHLSKAWEPKPMITESHPKVFHHLLSKVNQPVLRETALRLTEDLKTCTRGADHDHKKCAACKRDGHKQDATLAAVAAWAGIRPPCEWQDLYAEDPDLFNPSQVEVNYWMPVP